MSHGPSGLGGGSPVCWAIINVAIGNGRASASSVTRLVFVFMIILLSRGPRAPLTTSLRNNLDRADLGVLDFGREANLDFTVAHFDGDGLHIGLQRPARLDPNVEVFELLPLDVERKHTLARSGDALEGFGEMQLYYVLAVL